MGSPGESPTIGSATPFRADGVHFSLLAQRLQTGILPGTGGLAGRMTRRGTTDGMCISVEYEAVFTLVTRGRFLTSVSKFNINPMVEFLTSAQKTTARYPM